MSTDRIKTHRWYFVTMGIDTTTSCRAHRGLTVVFRGVETMDVTMSVSCTFVMARARHTGEICVSLVSLFGCLSPTYNRCGSRRVRRPSKPGTKRQAPRPRRVGLTNHRPGRAFAALLRVSAPCSVHAVCPLSVVRGRNRHSINTVSLLSWFFLLPDASY